MRPFTRCLVLVLWGGCPLVAQSLSGRVINSVTKDPVPNAALTLACVKPAIRGSRRCQSTTAKSAEDGTFKFDHLFAARFLLTADGAPGLVSTRASQLEFEFEYRHNPPDALLKLEPESAISGRVIDLQNHPRADVEVVAWRQFSTGSVRQLKPVARTLSDETGVYAFPHLIPGNYYVGTALVTTRQPSKLKTRPVEQFQLYAPSTLSLAEAVATHVDMGQSYSGIDLCLRPIITHKIQGRAQTETMDHNSYDKLELHLDARDSAGVTAPGREIFLEDDGSFQANVVPGNYILRLSGSTSVVNPKVVKGPPDTMLHLLARQELEVTGKDILSLTVLIPPPFTINGHVTVEGLPDDKLEKGDVTLRPIDAEAASGYQTAPVQPDGAFTITNCDAANYAVRYKPPAGMYVKAITFNGQDALTHMMDFSSISGGELKILLHPGPASVTANVQDSTDPADVVLIPDTWTQNELVPVIHAASKDGHYSATGIAPGHYTAVAVWGVERYLWEDAAFVHEMQARGLQFDLAESDQRQISVLRLTEDDLNQIRLQLGLYY